MIIENAKGIKATDKALLVLVEGQEVWIPQSQIHDDSEVWKAGDEGTLIIPDWLAVEKELMEEPEDICPWCHATSDQCHCEMY